MPNAVIAGSSGLTGSALLKLLLVNQQNEIVYTLGRCASVENSAHHCPLVVDFDALPTLPRCDLAYCCLGTTIKKAGSKEAFRKVDYDYVVNFARAAKETGVSRFLVVSALGANSKSSIFYSRVKGDMEDAIGELGFDSVHIFQPSFLLGDRAEARTGERIGIRAFKAISPLLLGRVRKYRPIAATDVARAMMNAAQSNKHGVTRYGYDEINTFSKGVESK